MNFPAAVPFGLCQVQDGGLVDADDVKGPVSQPVVVSLANQSSLSNGRHSSEAAGLPPRARADPQQRSAASADPTTPRGKFGRGVEIRACRRAECTPLTPRLAVWTVSAPHQGTRPTLEQACTAQLDRSAEIAMSSLHAAATSTMASKTIPSLVSIVCPFLIVGNGRV